MAVFFIFSLRCRPDEGLHRGHGAIKLPTGEWFWRYPVCITEPWTPLSYHRLAASTASPLLSQTNFPGIMTTTMVLIMTVVPLACEWSLWTIAGSVKTKPDGDFTCEVVSAQGG
ncbi:hypothetical protein Lal_00027052 [Lupinus albus]|nr:hypothetical protein Lal_00027052 [Lupinus albus]